MTSTTSEQTPDGPPVVRPMAVSLGVLVAGYLALLAAVVLLQVGIFLPIGVALGVYVLGRAAAAPRWGLIVAMACTLLFPIGLGFRVGPFSLSLGRVVGFAFVLGWIAAMSRPAGPLLRRTPLDLPMLALLLSYGLSMAANGPYFRGPEFGDAVQTTLRTAVDFIAFFYAAASVMGAGREHLDRVLRVTSLVLVGIGVLAIIDWVTQRSVFDIITPLLPGGTRNQVGNILDEAARERAGLRRALGTFEGPNKLGAVAVLGLPLLAHYGSTGPRRRRRPYLAGTVIVTLAGILTISRSVFVCIAAVLLVYTGASGLIKIGRSAVLAVVAVVIATMLLSPAIRDTMVLYFEGLAGRQEQSIQARLKDYDNVARQFDETPLAGSGPGTWSVRALRRPDTERVDPTDFGQTVLDNLFLSTIAERGAVGLLALGSLLLGGAGVALRSVRRATDAEERSLRSALLASLVAYALLCAFFDMFAFYAATKLYMLLLAATVTAANVTTAYRRPAVRSVPDETP